MTSKNRWVLVLALCAAPLALQGCFTVAAVGVGTAVVSGVDRRTTGAQIDDAGIELKVGNRISDKYGGKVHVSVTSYDRNVLLTGEVPNEQIKDDIGKIAAGVENVRGIVNELQIAGVPSDAAIANDAYLTAKVKARFIDANKFNSIHVKVVTEAGVVYLLGIVTQQEAADAVQIAATTDGVRKVVKVFEYCTPSEPRCAAPKPTVSKQPEKN
jgi:osmotically-inducible protein OsmY